MTMFEYAKNAYKTMKDKPPQERWEYFWDYYKWIVIVVALVIFVLIQSIITLANRKDVFFSGELINCLADTDLVEYDDRLGEHLGFDPEKEEIIFHTDVSFSDGGSGTDVDSFQILLAGIATKSTDFVVGQEKSFLQCAYHTSNMFADLRDCLDAETLAKLEGKLYYVDKAVKDQIDTTTLTMPETPDPFNPEVMADPIPVGIDITNCREFQDTYYPGEDALYLGIVINSTRTDITLEFIDYLFSN